MFTHDEEQWDANNEVGKEVERTTRSRHKIKETNVYERRNRNKEDQSKCRKAVVQDRITTLVP